MRAINLITEEIPPLTHSDTGEKALNWMEEFKVSHLPVLKDGNFVGVVSEADILDKMDLDKTLDELFQHLPRPYVLESDHIYQVLSRISELKLTVIPILNEDEKYLGCTSVQHLMLLIANTGSIKENGGRYYPFESKGFFFRAGSRCFGKIEQTKWSDDRRGHYPQNY